MKQRSQCEQRDEVALLKHAQTRKLETCMCRNS